MDTSEVAWLQTPEGRRLVDEAREALTSGVSELALLDRLRRRSTPEHARAVLALVEGRRAAARKFPDAERLYFDRAAAEQATSELVARHTAARFSRAGRVGDLGCGAGGDALALAEQAPVVAVDHDPARLAMLSANAAARGIGDRIHDLNGAVEDTSLPRDIDHAWLDPGRRDERGRVLDPRRWAPPLDVAIDLARRFGGAGIKVAPGIDLSAVPADGEIEFISLHGDLREAVVWLGDLVTAPRRATVLPRGESVAGPPGKQPGTVGAPGRYLLDPDLGVGRAGLVAELARQLGAWQLDERIAYLSVDEVPVSALVRCFRIETWLPFSERRLLAALREHGARRVEVMRRGSPVDTNALERRLNRRLASGERVLTVALTRVGGEHAAIVCERIR